MTLTMDTGPFGHRPADRFNVEIPAARCCSSIPPALGPRRRDRDRQPRVKLLHQHGMLGRCYFPRDDIRWDLLSDVEPVALVGDTAAGSQSGTRVPKGILAGPTGGS